MSPRLLLLESLPALSGHDDGALRMKYHSVLPASRLLGTAGAASALTPYPIVMPGNQGLQAAKLFTPEGIVKGL